MGLDPNKIFIVPVGRNLVVGDVILTLKTRSGPCLVSPFSILPDFFFFFPWSQKHLHSKHKKKSKRPEKIHASDYCLYPYLAHTGYTLMYDETRQRISAFLPHAHTSSTAQLQRSQHHDGHRPAIQQKLLYNPFFHPS